jgi:hypothetical protein
MMMRKDIHRFRQWQYPVFYQDPSPEQLHKERITLLVASLLGFAVSRAGMVPKEIEALGIKTGDLNPRILALLLATVTGYLTFVFCFHALRAYRLWKRTATRTVFEEMMRDEVAYVNLAERKNRAVEARMDLAKSFFWVRSVLTWLTVDVALVVALGSGATTSLIWFAR